MLALSGFISRRTRGTRYGVVAILARRKIRPFRRHKKSVLAARARPAGCVRHNHDRRLQAFRAMHGHHAHGLARAFHFALHLAGVSFDLMHEALQAWRGVRAGRERTRQQFFQRIARFSAEARKHPRPTRAALFVEAFQRPAQKRKRIVPGAFYKFSNRARAPAYIFRFPHASNATAMSLSAFGPPPAERCPRHRQSD